MVANTSLLIAVLVYMGWAYDAAFYGYFHVNPLDLNIGVIEYMLVSLSLFSPVLVIAVAILIVASAARTWHMDRSRLERLIGGRAVSRVWPVHSPGQVVPADSPERPQVGRALLIGAGGAVTVTALTLALIAKYVHVSTYTVLALLGCGPLLLTWPTRADQHGRFPHAMAIVLAAVCALWAASLYATHLGHDSAKKVAHDLSARTAVTLYTTEPLSLTGPGVHVKTLPAGSLYHYRYEGLRLLTMRSGTYYLLPARWSPSPNLDFTYIINSSDQTMIDLS